MTTPTTSAPAGAPEQVLSAEPPDTSVSQSVELRLGCILLGVALTVTAATGAASSWVTMPTWGAVSAGVVICALGLLPSGLECGCGSSHTTGWITTKGPLFLLIGVAIVIGILTPPQLNASQVTDATAGAAHSGGADTWPELSVDGAEMGLREFIARSAAPADARLTGRTASLVGTLHRDGGTVQLQRITIFCCAADARRFTVELTDLGGRLDRFADGDGVKITAGFLPGSGTQDTRWVPTAQVQAVVADPRGTVYDTGRPAL